MVKMKLTLLLTQDNKHGINKEEGIPWFFKEEAAFFKSKMDIVETKALVVDDPSLIDNDIQTFVITKDYNLPAVVRDAQVQNIDHLFLRGDQMLLRDLFIYYKQPTYLVLIKINAWYDCNSLVCLDTSNYTLLDSHTVCVTDEKTNQLIQIDCCHYQCV